MLELLALARTGPDARGDTRTVRVDRREVVKPGVVYLASRSGLPRDSDRGRQPPGATPALVGRHARAVAVRARACGGGRTASRAGRCSTTRELESWRARLEAELGALTRRAEVALGERTMSLAWSAYRLLSPVAGAVAPAARVCSAAAPSASAGASGWALRRCWTDASAWIHAASLGETTAVAPLGARAARARSAGPADAHQRTDWTPSPAGRASRRSAIRSRSHPSTRRRRCADFSCACGRRGCS